MSENSSNSEGLNPKKDDKLKKILNMFSNMFNPKTPPTKIEEYEINGNWRTEKIWENEDGSQFVSVTEVPMDEYLNNPKLSEDFIYETPQMEINIKDLENELDKAVKCENYENAAKLRDRIENLKNPSTVNEEDELWNI